ncbi:MAG: hypothetical protein AB7E49_07045 [Campylobacterales bacterium]
MPKSPVFVLLVSASRPMRLAVYDLGGNRLELHESDAPATESFYPFFKTIDDRYDIARVAYARGPGSFMGLKLGYVFLQSFAMARRIPFASVSSFALTRGAPVQAHGKRWFVLEGGEVSVRAFETPPQAALLPPEQIDFSIFEAACEPEYLMPAV